MKTNECSECGKSPVFSKGLCAAHYHKQRRKIKKLGFDSKTELFQVDVTELRNIISEAISSAIADYAQKKAIGAIESRFGEQKKLRKTRERKGPAETDAKVTVLGEDIPERFVRYTDWLIKKKMITEESKPKPVWSEKRQRLVYWYEPIYFKTTKEKSVPHNGSTTGCTENELLDYLNSQ